jgi:hypothetical protein
MLAYALSLQSFNTPKSSGICLTLDIKMALFFYSAFVWVSMIIVKFYSVQCGPNIGLGR